MIGRPKRTQCAALNLLNLKINSNIFISIFKIKVQKNDYYASILTQTIELINIGKSRSINGVFSFE